MYPTSLGKEDCTYLIREENDGLISENGNPRQLKIQQKEQCSLNVQLLKVIYMQLVSLKLGELGSSMSL